MYVISTGKRTVLSDFSDLSQLSDYEHTNGATTDLEFFRGRNVFVEINKTDGSVDLMRVREKLQEKADFQRIRRWAHPNAYCVSCSKRTMGEIALGMSNGQVKLFNYKRSELLHTFQAERICNSVLFLDYNFSDDYIATVFENGYINIYGKTTKTKTDTLDIDGSSTLARFHPTKKLQLSIASYKGAVTTFDIQTKKKLFHSIDAHGAPCTDLCMSPTTPDILVSAGFDCVVNIFDMRRKSRPKSLNYCHPLSTVAMSTCGTYFCVGNLKGELSTFDMRNTDVCLASKKVHDCAVSRIAFMQHNVEELSGGISFSSSNTSNQSVTAKSGCGSSAEHSEQPQSTTEQTLDVASLPKTAVTVVRGQRDSFCDFLDFQANRGNEKMSSRFAPRRDSFDWETLQRKPNVNMAEPRASICYGAGGGRSSSSFGLGSANNSAANSESFDDKQSSIDFQRSRGFPSALRDRNSLSMRTGRQGSEKLMEITEEQVNQKDATNASSNSSDKENPPNELELSARMRLPQNVAHSSTPHRESTKTAQQNENVDGATAPQTNAVAATNATTIGDSSTTTNALMNEITALRREINERFENLDTDAKLAEQFKRLEMSLNFTAERNKWHIFTQNFNLWHKQNKLIEDMHFALNVLLRSDTVMDEVQRLQMENEMLRQQLEQQQQSEK